MRSNWLVEKALSARNKGLSHLVIFLTIRFVFILGGVSFFLFVAGDFLFNYKAMQFFGVADSIKQSAFLSFVVIGLVPAVICFFVLENLYWKKK
jgi:hypothetical protein